MKNFSARPAFDPAAINNPQTRDYVAPKSAGSAVVRAQILLDRAHFSPGEIDGRYGDTLRGAVLGYQIFHHLTPTGIVDPETWKLLNADTAPALVPYVITAEEEAGPFRPVPRNIMEQAKLTALGYSSPAEELGERFHISPGLLGELNPTARLDTAGQQLMVPNVQRAYGQARGVRVLVSRSARTAAFADNGSLLAQYPATTASVHDPLPVGNRVITEVRQNPWFNYNPALFWDARPGDARVRIPPGPNNPVGVAWIGLSKAHFGIHGTPNPASVGHAESHGCIRLTNWDAEELSQMVAPGVPAILMEQLCGRAFCYFLPVLLQAPRRCTCGCGQAECSRLTWRACGRKTRRRRPPRPTGLSPRL
jgi:lipoprotein-anchoring transpeptidase ErfK/SrfK